MHHRIQISADIKERGICVPEDVSVTGFDDSIYAQLCSPPLTTVAVDTDAIARLAAKRMIKHMNEPQKKSGEGIPHSRKDYLPGFRL